MPSAVESEGEPTGTPIDPQGESEEISMDSNPGLEEFVRNVDQHYRQLLRNINLKREEKFPSGLGSVRVDCRQRAAIYQWTQGVKPKTHWEVNCMEQNAKATPRQRWIRRQLRIEFHPSILSTPYPS